MCLVAFYWVCFPCTLPRVFIGEPRLAFSSNAPNFKLRHYRSEGRGTTDPVAQMSLPVPTQAKLRLHHALFIGPFPATGEMRRPGLRAEEKRGRSRDGPSPGRWPRPALGGG